jgi:Fur family zinc uptake transcriptional regulator
MATQNIIKQAESAAKEKGLRFTEQRRAALEIIADAEKPLGAYDVLERLGKYIQNPKPPIAYRALEFLQENGFIHRIESLNAYVTCSANHQHKGSQFMICDGCGNVTEAHLCTVPEALQTKAHKAGFKTSYWNVELHGLCGDCQR